jgi:hypothetical protein
MSFTNTWASATVEEQGGNDAPAPGLYTVAVVDAKAFTSKKGDDWVIIELRGLDGASTDHEWPLLLGFKSQEQANFTKRACRDLGVDVDNVTGLEALDEALKAACVGRYFNVEVKQNGEYRNTYLQGPSEGVQGDLGDGSPPERRSVTTTCRSRR